MEETLRAAGIVEADAARLLPDVDARRWESALAFAKRRRIGPYAAEPPDRSGRDQAFAALLRAGHDLDTARAILAMAPGDDPEAGQA